MVECLRADLTDGQLVGLTEMTAVENLGSRTNSALGLRSQGLKDHCGVPRPMTDRLDLTAAFAAHRTVTGPQPVASAAGPA